MADIDTANRSAPMVPIRSLAPRHRERIAAHLLALDEHDRYLRFGYAASEEQIRRYVELLISNAMRSSASSTGGSS